jgi:TrmH family RNA methyltransferase
MLSKSIRQKIRSLQQKKYRQELGLFLVETPHVFLEFLASDYVLFRAFCTASFLDKIDLKFHDYVEVVSHEELNEISALETAHDVVGVFEEQKFQAEPNYKGLMLALDEINNPGNLGNLIRTADWFGVKEIFLSPNSVEVYNPKVVQASMGSLSRVKIFTKDLQALIQDLKNQNIACFGADLSENNLFASHFSKHENALLVLGNEAHGLNPKLKENLTLLSIPRIGQAESLNITTAAAIFCAEFTRASETL